MDKSQEAVYQDFTKAPENVCCYLLKSKMEIAELENLVKQT